MAVIMMMVSATFLSGIADGQQFQQQPAAGNPGAQAPSSAGAGTSPVIQGLEGLRGRLATAS
jgi:hypothetical protein